MTKTFVYLYRGGEIEARVRAASRAEAYLLVLSPVEKQEVRLTVQPHMLWPGFWEAVEDDLDSTHHPILHKIRDVPDSVCQSCSQFWEGECRAFETSHSPEETHQRRRGVSQMGCSYPPALLRSRPLETLVDAESTKDN